MKILINESQLKSIILSEQGEDNFFISFLTKFISAHKFILPIHLRALAFFLIGRTTPFTADEMTQEEKDFIKKTAIQRSIKGFNFGFWDKDEKGKSGEEIGKHRSANAIAEKIPLGSLINPTLNNQFMWFLGSVDAQNIKVSPNQSKVTIIDNYDMNAARDNKTKEMLIQSFVSSIKRYFNHKMGLYMVIRSVVGLREMNGYKGYPVNITL
jgi:hypothetical protein